MACKIPLNINNNVPIQGMIAAPVFIKPDLETDLIDIEKRDEILGKGITALRNCMSIGKSGVLMKMHRLEVLVSVQIYNEDFVVLFENYKPSRITSIQQGL